MTTPSLAFTPHRTGESGTRLPPPPPPSPTFSLTTAPPSSPLPPASAGRSFTLHIIDIDPNSSSADGWLEDVSKVQKYEISEEDYNARENTYRKFKEQKLKEDPTWTLQKEIAKRSGKEYKEPQQDPEFQAKEAEAVKPGMRCEVFPGGKRGEVMYVGKCEGLPLGFWVGVKYDEPIGKNDGQVKGKRYFECAPKYGGMVRPANLKVGDFPPVDDDIDFSDSEEEI